MKPRDIPSRWLKLAPWYYIRTGSPPRKAERKRAIVRDLADSGFSAQPCEFYDEHYQVDDDCEVRKVQDD